MAEQLPNVGRPRGSAWRKLQDEGIIWEGQILIAGDEADLAALLVVTAERLAFVRGNAVALEIERDWLYPTPVMRRNGAVLLWVAAPDTLTSETLSIIVRDGRREAARLVSLLSPQEETWSTPAALPTYVPSSSPTAPSVPMANHYNRESLNERSSDNEPSSSETDSEFVLPMFSTLDGDDFPPISNRPVAAVGWGERIDLSGDIEGPVALAGSVRDPDSPLIPVPGLESRDERDRKAWIIRVSGLVAAFALFAAFASGMMPGWSDIRDAINRDEPTVVTVAEVAAPTPLPTQTEAPAISAGEPSPTPSLTAENGPQTSDPQNPTVVPEETARVLGVGGMDDDELSPTSEPTNTPTVAPSPTLEPTKAPTEAPSPTREATEASQTPASNAVEIAQASTEEPAEQTPIIPPLESTATSAPTQEPATEGPTKETDTSAVVAASPANTVNNNDSSADLVSEQPATLASEEIPADVFALNGIRYSIDQAFRAESVPELTLGRSQTGEWVVLILSAANWSEAVETLTMADFRIAAVSDVATEYPLNATTGSVASYLGMNPIMKDGDTNDLNAGNEQDIALVFEIPAGLGDLDLLAGDQLVSLQSSFDRASTGASGGGDGVNPDLLSATVTDIIDGGAIVVEAGGESFTVQYAGVVAPAADACYAAESTTANSNLVLGQTVLLERQRRSRVSTDVYLRDAWLVDADGNRTLASAQLVDAGALTAAPKSPDTRFQGWLNGEQQLAENAGNGLWSACQSPTTESA